MPIKPEVEGSNQARSAALKHEKMPEKIFKKHLNESLQFKFCQEKNKKIK
jgi:hypothetical protein